MKKALLITLTLTAGILMSACSMAKVEKQPIKIPDTDQLSINDDSGIADSTSENDSNGNNAATSEEAATLTIQREGVEETIPGTLYKSSIGYEIIYTEDFQRTTEGNADSFVVNNSDPDLYPYVYLNISKIEGSSATEYAEKLSRELKLSSIYQSVETSNNETIGNNYNAIMITASSGDDWNSVIRNYYVIEVSDTVYQIETQYFLEATEGYGSIIDAMLNTFFVQ